MLIGFLSALLTFLTAFMPKMVERARKTGNGMIRLLFRKGERR